jgi:hypothetical protein
MNSNRHALPIIDAVKLAGVEPTARGLRFEPRVPGEAVSLHTPAVTFEHDAQRVRAVVDFATAGEVELALPEVWGGAARVEIRVGDAPVEARGAAGSVIVPVPAGQTQVVMTLAGGQP